MPAYAIRIDTLKNKVSRLGRRFYLEMRLGEVDSKWGLGMSIGYAR